MKARVLRPEFYDDVIERAGSSLVLAGYGTTMRRRFVERGIVRAQGGQSMARPRGITSEVLDQINMADAAQDARLMSAATALAVVLAGMTAGSVPVSDWPPS